MPGAPAPTTAATGTPAFACDSHGRLTVWTRAAERLLHIRAAGALGRRCHDVVAGRDVLGHATCREEGPIRAMARRHQHVRPFRLDVFEESGTTPALRVSIVASGRPGAEPSLIHVIEPITEGPIPRIAEEFHQPVTSPTRVRLDHLTRAAYHCRCLTEEQRKSIIRADRARSHPEMRALRGAPAAARCGEKRSSPAVRVAPELMAGSLSRPCRRPGVPPPPRRLLCPTHWADLTWCRPTRFGACPCSAVSVERSEETGG